MTPGTGSGAARGATLRAWPWSTATRAGSAGEAALASAKAYMTAQRYT